MVVVDRDLAAKYMQECAKKHSGEGQSSGVGLSEQHAYKQSPPKSAPT